jgi:hypothetical protein
VIRNVGRLLPWLVRTSDEPDRNWYTRIHLTQASSQETTAAVAALIGNLRKRYDTLTTVASRMMEKLRAEVESTPSSTTMDPEGTGVQALEEAEEYFRIECEQLCDIREALDRSGGAEAHGRAIFDELERVRALFATVVAWSQEMRWLLMINDGTLAPTTGRTFTSGAELVSALDDS